MGKVFVMNFAFSPDWENNFDHMTPEEYTLALDACPQVASISLSGDKEWERTCRRKVLTYMMSYWEDCEDWETSLKWGSAVTWELVQTSVDEKTGHVSNFFSASLDGEVQALMVLSERSLD